ncbi:hypothetical protein RISK_003608 [Rhodopirellula islandica]|uniref:Uncharacterized protein n=1 Tax=Rhodopirellula islandica TaxID=595434 RepID=A0A0J1EG88_RHOIS|nr:hypothetical protein RISK_003608 [Rhodopirellula islandica]
MTHGGSLREEEKGGEPCRLQGLNEWGAGFLGRRQKKIGAISSAMR